MAYSQRLLEQHNRKQSNKIFLNLQIASLSRAQVLAADIQIKDKVKEAKLITDKASSQQQLIIIEVVLLMKSRRMHIGARLFVSFSIRIWLIAEPKRL